MKSLMILQLNRFSFLMLFLVTFCCPKESQAANLYDNPPCPPAVKDYDGNVYKTVQIGEQCWMRENMRTKHCTDSTAIPLSNDPRNSTMAYRYVPNNNTDGSSCGYLYKYSAAVRICPQGWHLPSKAEFEILKTYCGHHYAVGGNLEYIGKALAAKSGWSSYYGNYTVGNNQSANNISGFSALPTGYYSDNDYWSDYACFWSATSEGTDKAYHLYLIYDYEYAGLQLTTCYDYLSVRCVKD